MWNSIDMRYVMRRFPILLLLPALALVVGGCAAAMAKDKQPKPSTDGMILVPAGTFSMGDG